jgi:C4-dicarboxylate-specific signal transduction histidine kinase
MEQAMINLLKNAADAARKVKPRYMYSGCMMAGASM